MKKRLLSILLMLSLLFSLIPTLGSSVAAEADTEITTVTLSAPDMYVVDFVPGYNEFFAPIYAEYAVSAAFFTAAEADYISGTGWANAEDFLAEGTNYAYLLLEAKEGYTFAAGATYTVGGEVWTVATDTDIPEDELWITHTVTAVAPTVTETLDFWYSNVRNAYATETNGIRWDSATYTLYLNNVIVVGDDFCAIEAPDGCTIDISGHCYLSGNSSNDSHYGALYIDNHGATIQGDGTLTAKSHCSTNWSAGIECYDNLIFSGDVKVITVGSDTTDDSFGLFNDGSVIVKDNASVTAIGGNADGESYGIYVDDYYYDGDFTVDGGSLVAIAGAAGSYSCGLYNDYWNFHMNGGDARIIGQSTGMYIDCDCVLKGGNLSVYGTQYGISAYGVAVYGGNTVTKSEGYGVSADGLTIDNQYAGTFKTVGATPIDPYYMPDGPFDNGILPTTGKEGELDYVSYTVTAKDKTAYVNSCVESLINQTAVTGDDDRLTISNISFDKGELWQFYSFGEKDIAAGNEYFGGDADLASAIGFTDGLILSTGDAKECFYGKKYGADGINTQYYADGATVDEDLATTTSFQTYDAATLQFSVTVPETALEGCYLCFNYAFATYEMNADARYNDAFALFVKDNDASGNEPYQTYTNTAKMASDESKNVCVASIRALAQEDNNYNPELCGVQFSYNSGWQAVPTYPLYQAVTDVYSTRVQAIPGHTYTFKFAIADASDSTYGTVAFIEAGSLRLGLEAPTVNGLGNGTILKRLTKDQLTFSATNTGTVYMVPAGKSYTSIADLQNGCKASAVVSAVDPGTGTGTTDKVAIHGISQGSYVAYLVKNGKMSLPSTPFYISLEAISQAADFTSDSVAGEAALETNGGDAAFTAGADGNPNTLVLNDIEVLSENEEAAVVLPGNTTIQTEEYDSAIRASKGTALEVSGEGPLPLENKNDLLLTAAEKGINAENADVAITGDGNITVKAGDDGINAATFEASAGMLNITAGGTGISTSGDVNIANTTNISAENGIVSGSDVELSGDITIRATNYGIQCGTLEIKDGTLTIKSDNGLPLEITKLIIPENYEIVGGSVNEEGAFTPDENTKEIIIRPNAAMYCEYAAPLTAGEQRLLLGGIEAGTFTVTGATYKGFQLKNADGEYVAYNNGKIELQKSAFTWKYDGGLYAETKTTAHHLFPFLWKLGFVTMTTTRSYLATDGENLTAAPSKQTAEMVVVVLGHDCEYKQVDETHHQLVCKKCNYEEPVEEHQYDETTHLCKCGKMNPQYCRISNVKVDCQKVRKIVGWWFFGRAYMQYEYTAQITKENVDVVSVKMSADNQNWTYGSKLTSDIKLSSLYVCIKDSNGVETTWYWNGTETTQR